MLTTAAELKFNMRSGEHPLLNYPLAATSCDLSLCNESVNFLLKGLHYFTLTFKPEMLESKSKAQKARL